MNPRLAFSREVYQHLIYLSAVVTSLNEVVIEKEITDFTMHQRGDNSGGYEHEAEGSRSEEEESEE